MVISSSLNSIGHIKTEQSKKARTETLCGRRGGKVSENSMKATAVSSRLRSDSIRSFKRNSCHHKLPFHARFLRLPLSAPSQRLPTAPINLQATPCSPPLPAASSHCRSQAKGSFTQEGGGKNVDKFLICNTLGMGLLPLFECKCINKAKRRFQGESDEKQKTRNFMAISGVG